MIYTGQRMINLSWNFMVPPFYFEIPGNIARRFDSNVWGPMIMIRWYFRIYGSYECFYLRMRTVWIALASEWISQNSLTEVDQVELWWREFYLHKVSSDFVAGWKYFSVLFGASIGFVLPAADNELRRTNRQYDGNQQYIWSCEPIACIRAPCPPCIWMKRPIPTLPPTLPPMEV